MYPSHGLGTSLRLKAWFQSTFRSAPHKTARGQFESARPAAFPRFGLKIGSSAAHDGFCLMLLGSPPDMVHSPPLRSTGLSSPCGRLPRRACVPPCPHHPRCSGLRVQGTANAPMCAALCGAERYSFVSLHGFAALYASGSSGGGVSGSVVPPGSVEPPGSVVPPGSVLPPGFS